MASSKDILDAQRFNKRRLISVFTSGMPGGREIELRSPVGPLVVGAAITVIILFGAWLFGRFSPGLPQNWQSGMLIVDSDTGARYFSIDGTLHPVRNAVSAQLLAEGPNLPRSTVGSGVLRDIPRGPEIGIAGAPDGLPPADRLRNTGWLACPAGEGETHLTIGGPVLPPTGADSGLVRANGRIFLVTEGRRHPVTEEQLATVRIAFGWETAPITDVGTAWIDLFDLGTELRPWQLAGAGTPAAGLSGPLAGASIGTMVEVPDGEQIRNYLVVGDGTLALMTPVQARLYLVGGGSEAGSPLRASLADITGLTVQSEGVPGMPQGSDWPANIPRPNQEQAVPCALLVESGGRTSTAVVQAYPPEAPGIAVAGGSGALVRATSGGSLGSLFLVSDNGFAFGLEGDENDIVQRLGYQPENITNIPAPWIRLPQAGPSLSSNAAWASVPAAGNS